MGKPDVEKMKAKKDVKSLIKALKDEDKNIRAYAAGALREIGDARAVEPLTKSLEYRTKDVRKAAEEALEKIKGKKG